jgi:hypothetical protein
LKIKRFLLNLPLEKLMERMAKNLVLTLPLVIIIVILTLIIMTDERPISQTTECCGDDICEDYLNCPEDCEPPEPCPECEECADNESCPPCPDCKCETTQTIAIPWNTGSGGDADNGEIECDVAIDLRDSGQDFVASGKIMIGNSGELRIEGEGETAEGEGELNLIISGNRLYINIPNQSPDWFYHELPEEMSEIFSCSYREFQENEFNVPDGVDLKPLEEAIGETNMSIR